MRNKKYLLLMMLCIVIVAVYRNRPEPEPALEPVGIPVAYNDTDDEKPKAIQTQESYVPKASLCEPIIIPEKDGEIDDLFISIAKEELSIVPERLQKAFVQSGWHMYITDANINLKYYGGKYKTVMATTNYDEKRILIEDSESAVRESVIHELGHWFDYQHGFLSNSDEFENIYTKESKVFIQAYGTACVRDQMEFFAEGFWQYIENPSKLQLETPNLYQYIKENIRK